MKTNRRAQSTIKNTPLKNNIAVNKVEDGEETNPLWTSEIDSQSFQMWCTFMLNSAYSLNMSLASVAFIKAG